MAEPFSYDGFRDLLDGLRAGGYRCLRFDEPKGPPRRVYLRHDVDLSPRAALALGRIEAEAGVRASFFFLPDSEAYTLLSDGVLAVLDELRKAGHGIGLHLDARRFGTDEARLALTLEWFRKAVAPVDPMVSFHRPAPELLGREFRAFLCPYDPRFFSKDRYLSDSRRNPAFLPELRRWTAEGREEIQLLLHPEWWYPQPDLKRLWEELRSRRTHELEAYVVRNFAQPFQGVVEHDAHRAFGL